eukprot:2648818-Pyramimonas_sp.AAC.2
MLAGQVLYVADGVVTPMDISPAWDSYFWCSRQYVRPEFIGVASTAPARRSGRSPSGPLISSHAAPQWRPCNATTSCTKSYVHISRT